MSDLKPVVVGSNLRLGKIFFHIFFTKTDPCIENRETPVQITGKALLGLQGNPCLDYRDFAVQGLYRASLLYVHASYRVESEHRDSLFKLQGKN